MLVPPVETREVTRVPRLAEPRGTQIPVWADFTRHDAQVVPKIAYRWPAPEAVAVIDALLQIQRYQCGIDRRCAPRYREVHQR